MKVYLIMILFVFVGVFCFSQTEASGGIETSLLLDYVDLDSAHSSKINDIKVSADISLLLDKCFFITGKVDLLSNGIEALCYQIDPGFSFGFYVYDISFGMRGTYELDLYDSGSSYMNRKKTEFFVRYNF